MSEISHDTLLFNLHDFVLMMSVLLYLFLSVTLFALATRNSDKSAFFLAVVLILYAAQSIDTLFIWSTPVRLLILAWQPNLLFVGGLGYWLLGPVLLFFVMSLVNSNFKIDRLYALHFLPALVVFILLIKNYYSLPTSIQVKSMSNLSLMWTVFMDDLIILRYLSVIGYGSWCLVKLTRYHKYKGKPFGSSLLVNLWSPWVVIGSIVIMSWALMVHLIGSKIPLNIANLLGLCTNYLTYIFVAVLAFTALRTGQAAQKVAEQEIEASYPGSNIDSAMFNRLPIKPELITRLERYIIDEKPFLESNISLERLSKQLSVPERTLSRIVNQHFKQNFVEYINGLRIEEAKNLLKLEELRSKTILDIMVESGFNSKSTFNLTFKQQVGMTPTQFRKVHLQVEHC